MTVAGRRERDARRSNSWMVALPLATLVVVALAWSGFWYFASTAAETTMQGWREREAKLGRIYSCGSQTLSGYPFRIEVRCTEPDAELGGNGRPLEIKAKDLVVVSQVYDPTLLISEFRGPLTAAEPGGAPIWTADWSLAQTSVRGRPAAPERVSVVFDNVTLAHEDGTDHGMPVVAKADRLELHGRIVGGSANDNPIVEIALRLAAASAPGAHPMAAEPISGEMRLLLAGLKDLSARPWPVELRELQAAGGRIEFEQVRLQQASSIVVGSGILHLTPRGGLDGQLQLTVVGLDRLLAGLDIDRAASQLISQADLDKIAPGLDANKLSRGLDRIMPGLGGALRQNSGVIAAAGVSALGQKTTLEGRPAVTLPLRLSDGAAFLGPLRLGDIAPLF